MKWPIAQLRGAILVASEHVRRFELNERDLATPDLELLLEAAGVRATLDELLSYSVDVRAPGSQTHGAILIVSAPNCPSNLIVRQVLAALMANNLVAISHNRTTGTVARIVLDSLQFAAPAGGLIQFEDEPFRLEWKQLSIVVLTPAHVYFNERPWVGWEFEPELDCSLSELVDFYRRSPIASGLLPEFQDRGLGSALQAQFAE